MIQEHSIRKIRFSNVHRNELLSHCLRKLNNIFIPDETKETKAYGLIGGTVGDEELIIGRVAPLYKNSRSVGAEKVYMDEMLDKHAKPSVTPLEKRAWVADPFETMEIVKAFGEQGMDLVGTYHMHRVSWKGDSNRQKPTELDTILGKDTGLFMFIISVVEPENPVVRGFYEGYPDREVPILS